MDCQDGLLIARQIIDQLLSQIILPQRRTFIRTSDLTVQPSGDNLRIVKVIQQQYYNFCGYHAMFNMIQFIKMLRQQFKDQKRQDPVLSSSNSQKSKGSKKKFKITIQIQEGQLPILRKASFWSFKAQVQRFLYNFKMKNKLTNFPWSQDQIVHGDFQRSFQQACRKYLRIVHQTFESDQIMVIQSATWHLQFGNLNMTDQDRDDLDKKIQMLINWHQTRPFILTLMLGVTNHWTSMAIVKIRQNITFWYFDSKNRNVLNRKPSQLKLLLQEIQRQYVQYHSGKPMPQWQRKVLQQYITDIQLTYDVLYSCVSGDFTLQNFYVQKTLDIICHDTRKIDPKDIQSVVKWASQYKHNIIHFYCKRWNYFKSRLCKGSIRILDQIRKFVGTAAQTMPQKQYKFWNIFSAIMN